MISRQIQVVLAVLAIIAIPVLTAILVVAPLDRQARADGTSLTTVETLNTAQAARNGELKSSSAQIAALQLKADELAAALPAKPEVAALLTNIGALSDAKSVTILSFSSGGAAAAGTGTSSTSSAATPTPAPSASLPATSTVAGAASTTGVTSVQFTVQVSGALSDVRDFVGALQRATRVIGLSAVSISLDTTTGLFTGAVTGSAYVLPATSSTPATTTTTTAG